MIGDRRLNPVVVDAEADMVFSDEIDDIVDVINELVERWLGRRTDERRKADHANQAAGPGSRLDLFVRDIARRVLDCLRVRVREDDGREDASIASIVVR